MWSLQNPEQWWTNPDQGLWTSTQNLLMGGPGVWEPSCTAPGLWGSVCLKITFFSPSCPIPCRWFHISLSTHLNICRDVYLCMSPAAVNAAGRRAEGLTHLQTMLRIKMMAPDNLTGTILIPEENKVTCKRLAMAWSQVVLQMRAEEMNWLQHCK